MVVEKCGGKKETNLENVRLLDGSEVRKPPRSDSMYGMYQKFEEIKKKQKEEW